jgi:glutathione S-transferase
MILFGASISPFVRKVLMCANEKGLTLEHRPVSPHVDDPQFRAASPLGKIPAFQDGDYTLADSSAIVHYLDAKYAAKPVLPADARARGKAIWFEEYCDTVLFPTASMIFVNRVLFPKFRKVPGDTAKADELAANQIPPLFAYLESVVPAQGFIVGDSFSIADAAITCQLINLQHSDVTVDAAKYPKLAAYFKRMSARASVAELVAAEQKLIQMMEKQ